MDRKKSISSSETSHLVVVKKAEFALNGDKKRLEKEVLFEIPNGPSNVSTIKRAAKLPALSGGKPLTTSAVHRSLSTSTERESYRSVKKFKLPAISPRAVTIEKNIFSNAKESLCDSENTLSSPESSSEEEASTSHRHSLYRSHVRIIHNVRLVWLTSDTSRSEATLSESLNQFCQVVDMIKAFLDVEKCINFLQTTTGETVFFVVSADLGQSTVKRIHDLPQLESIFLLGKPVKKRKRWIEAWPKIKGFYSDINSIYDAVSEGTEKCRRNSITISDTHADIDCRTSSFIYTKLLKEILLEMAYDDNAKKSFIQFCRRRSKEKKTTKGSKTIDEFERDNFNSPIWWYTRDCFIYEMVNQAFRLKEIDIILKAGFFIQALQRQIERLHIQFTEKLILFRGQGLTYADFDQLRRMKGSLYFFNSVLSTSLLEKVGHHYADAARQNPKQIGILFRIEVDPVSLTSTRLASLDDESCFFDTEKEVLFSMHTAFRVGEMKQIDERLWQVELTLVNEDDDDDLQQRTEQLRQATQGSTVWDRLGKLLLKMHNFDKAEEVFEVLIANLTGLSTEEDGHRYHMMGVIKKCKKLYDEALTFYYKALAIYQKVSNVNFVELISIYNDIALVYKETTRYLEALEYYQKMLHIQENYALVHKSDLVSTYGNLADMFEKIEQYPEALQYQQKKLHIHKNSYPVNVLALITTYQSIGEIHYTMQEYTEALNLFKKASTFRKHYLPDMKADAATSHMRVGQVYDKMGDYSKALACYDDALRLLERFHSEDSLQVADIYNNIAHVYKNMKQYTEALDYYRKTCKIVDRFDQRKILDEFDQWKILDGFDQWKILDRLDQGKILDQQKILDQFNQSRREKLATTLDNIGQMYEMSGNYEKALLSYRKAIVMVRQFLPDNHLELRLYQTHLTKLSKTVDTDSCK